MNKLIISLEAIAANYSMLAKKFSGAECGAVVKANGYGLGALPIARKLAKTGCQKFFVATMEEGIALRKIMKEQIYVFHGVQKNDVNAFTEHGLIPVLNNPLQLEIWPKDMPCALHYDTGMTRLGLDVNEGKLERDIILIMSHLAFTEDEQHPMNRQQLETFKKIAALYPEIPKSLCNSHAVNFSDEYHFDVARPGIALYGGSNKDMKNVVTITASILQIHQVMKPQTVGYGGDYKAMPGDIIATIPIGYADGILRSLGNKGKVYCGGYELPIVGRISMDLVTIKINNLPPELRRVGQMVEVLGEKYNILDMAADAGTIEYEIITRLGNRFERVYTE